MRSSLLSPHAARDFGRALHTIRVVQKRTLLDAAKVSGLSPQYLQNIEAGRKTNLTPTSLEALPRAYAIPSAMAENLWLRARVMGALEERGLDTAQRLHVWRAAESRLDELGFEVRDMMARFLGEQFE